MPNYVTNILEFDCSDEEFREIAEFLRGDNKDEPLGHVDFNVLIPMPESLMIESGLVGERGYEAYASFMMEAYGQPPKAAAELEAQHKAKLDDPEAWDLGKKYYENLRDYGAKTWYQWSYQNWGTKWNACDCEPADADHHRLCFLTAWECVPKILEKISEHFPETQIVYSYADEDIGSNVGVLVYENGEIIGANLPNNGSREAYELAADILGEDLKDMGFILSKDGTMYHFDMDAAEGIVEEHPLPSEEER